jgi:outer membrane protein OmpA-like peptidoglycan-associated protein
MKWTLAAAATAVAMVLGCGATRPPNQLVDARSAYQKASVNPAAPMAAANLVDAKRSLDAAERAFREGELTKAKNLAYIAHRKALAAEAKAETMRLVEAKRVALADFQHFREMQAIARREQLEREKGIEAKAQREADAEKKAREATEEKISQLGGVQVERADRGLVLTISGATLFASEPKHGHDEDELLDAGKDRLAEVAKALKDDKRTILVVAHTDDRGKHDANRRLSEERAEAVRRYLQREGIDEQRLRSEGMGDSAPIADNASKEGRAENRRIEIVLEASPGSGHVEAPPPLPEREKTKEKTKGPPRK